MATRPAKKPAARRARPPRVDQAPVEQPAANSARGEHELPLNDGVTYRLRPSREALKAIEAKTKTSFLALARLGNTLDLSLTQLGIIAAELIRAGADDEATRHVSADRLEELIVETDVIRCTVRLTACLVDAGTGGRDAEGNAKPATA